METVGSSETSQQTFTTERINPKGIYLNYFHVMMEAEPVSETHCKEVEQPLNRNEGSRKLKLPDFKTIGNSRW
jgi:hypothetical protein